MCQFRKNREYRAFRSNKKGKTLFLFKFLTTSIYSINNKKYTAYEYAIKPVDKTRVVKLVLILKGKELKSIDDIAGFTLVDYSKGSKKDNSTGTKIKAALFNSNNDPKKKKSTLLTAILVYLYSKDDLKKFTKSLFNEARGDFRDDDDFRDYDGFRDDPACQDLEALSKNPDFKKSEAINIIAKILGNHDFDSFLEKFDRQDVLYYIIQYCKKSMSKEDLQEELKKRKKNELIEKLVKYSSIGALVTSVIAVLFFIYKHYKNMEIVVAEKEAEIAERKLSEKIYGSEKTDESAFNDYIDLITAIKNVVKSENIKGCLVYGRAGTGKTYVVRRTLYKLGVKYKFIKGGVDTLPAFFKLLYENNKGLLVLDDFDTPLQDPDFINVLKAATDTSEPRIIAVPRVEQITKDTVLTIPQKFVYKGKIIIITNLDKSKIDPAILSRLISVEVNFSNEKIIEVIKKMMKNISPDIPLETKQEVLNYLIKLKNRKKLLVIDFRVFSKALDMRVMYPDDWKKRLEEIL